MLRWAAYPGDGPRRNGYEFRRRFVLTEPALACHWPTPRTTSVLDAAAHRSLHPAHRPARDRTRLLALGVLGLLANTTRSVFAEYLVGLALRRSGCTEVRVHSVDLFGVSDFL